MSKPGAGVKREVTSSSLSVAGPGVPAAVPHRSRGGREAILAAAAEQFGERGYIAVTVEELAAAAGVSRMTFYRHFSSKVELSIELFQRELARAKPRYLQITREAFHDRTVVTRWIATLFEADRENRRLLKVFSQATAEGAAFTERAQEMIAELIVEFGTAIPAFHACPKRSDQRRRWVAAWLLVYEILDQSNHAALDLGVANDPLVIDILADRFLDFVNGTA